jgi:phosphoenolpyruvate carboxykinase (ATP)
MKVPSFIMPGLRPGPAQAFLSSRQRFGADTATGADQISLSIHPLLREAGLAGVGTVYHQLKPEKLVKEAVSRQEGTLTKSGILVVHTGKYTGRSPKDRFFVDTPAVHPEIAWGKENIPVSAEVFDRVHDKIKTYLKGKDVFVFDGIAGADPKYAMPVRLVNERASQNLFMHHMLVRPTKKQLQTHTPQLTVIAAPGLKLDPQADGVNSEVGILVNLEKRLVLIAGTQYSGELKKGIFTVMNYLLPKQNVLPLHSGAAMDKQTGRVGLILGLSGTGKTTLATTKDLMFVGDDEVGWSDRGVFNFEGGSYATANHLSPIAEPEIYGAVRKGAIAENVVINPQSGELDYGDDSLAENTRVAYPIHNIPGVKRSGRVDKHPSAVVFLTSDAFGVLPPIAKLTHEQALAYFVNGYTSKLGGTERGLTKPEATFSACFGAPFMPRSPLVYAKLMAERLKTFPADVYLLNTGWQGGPYGTGKRLGIPESRILLKAAINGALDGQAFRLDPNFQIQVPVTCPGVSADLLDPRKNWQDKAAYDASAARLSQMFTDNLRKFPDFPSVLAVLNATKP